MSVIDRLFGFKVATLAGNLSMKHKQREFRSDIFLIFETAGATLRIREIQGTTKTVSMQAFLDMNMNRKVITNVILPGISSNHYVLRTYKIMPRKQDALALVAAGFLFRIVNNDYFIEEKPKIIFNGINSTFIHASETERVMTKRKLLDPSLIKEAMATLQKELKPDSNPLWTSPEYRRLLSCSLLYKFILKVGFGNVNQFVRSGGELLLRPPQTATQDFTYGKTNAPAGEPIEKLEALIQCAGEAEYVDDIPRYPNELFGTFVLANEAAATILSVDPASALVIKFIVKGSLSSGIYFFHEKINVDQNHINGTDFINYSYRRHAKQ